MTLARIRSGLGGLLAAGAIVLLLWLFGMGYNVAAVQKDTEAKLERAASIHAAHNKALVQIYEKALIACLYGVGFTIGRTVIMCSPQKVAE